MNRLALLLLAALVASSLYLVRTTDQARQLFIALESENKLATQLHEEEKRVQAELRNEARRLNVERIARTRLAMRDAGADTTLYVAVPLQVAQAAAAQASGQPAGVGAGGQGVQP